MPAAHQTLSPPLLLQIIKAPPNPKSSTPHPLQNPQLPQTPTTQPPFQNPRKPNKTIMMVGARGSGKTTLINAMINYILNVERKDHFRFKLVTETTNTSQAHSQTSEIIVYEINHREGFNIPFSLTIIDTPGFGDTWGMSQDDEIVEQIGKFFSKTGGIDQIDCICFVVQAALSFLSVTQNSIFNSILSIFGKDIEENIQILVTFADGQPPPVLTAIEEAQVPCSKTKENRPVHFKFNNSAVFAKRTENTNDDEGNDSDAEEFDEMFWRMGTKSMEKYFTALGKMETKNLSLTKEVLSEREHLQTAVEGLQPQINAGLVNLEELRKTTAALEQHKTLMDENKDFEYEVEITVGEKEDVEHVLTCCQLCGFTCHENCLLANDEDKIHCVAMKDGKCTVCPGKCVWNVHSNQTYKWIYITKKEKRTYGELKKKYEGALGEKMTTEKMFQQLQMEFDVCEQKVLELVEETSWCLERLKEIALRPNPLQTPEYIDLLIEGEKQEGHMPCITMACKQTSKQLIECLLSGLSTQASTPIKRLIRNGKLGKRLAIANRSNETPP
uniref:Si:ch73-170d6.2 n=1 Tax=Eptatretus burgeri TaxID=7764 RepID=A0A8C4WUZ4_EPTBU